MAGFVGPITGTALKRGYDREGRTGYETSNEIENRCRQHVKV